MIELGRKVYFLVDLCLNFWFFWLEWLKCFDFFGYGCLVCKYIKLVNELILNINKLVFFFKYNYNNFNCLMRFKYGKY